jgi:hypothetical protein
MEKLREIGELIQNFFRLNIAISSKVLIILLVLFAVWFADNITGFSFFYQTNKKMEQILSINNILADSSLSKKEEDHLLSLRNKILMRENVVDYFSSYSHNLFEKLKKTTVNNPVKPRNPSFPNVNENNINVKTFNRDTSTNVLISVTTNSPICLDNDFSSDVSIRSLYYYIIIVPLLICLIFSLLVSIKYKSLNSVICLLFLIAIYFILSIFLHWFFYSFFLEINWFIKSLAVINSTVISMIILDKVMVLFKIKKLK